MKMQNLLFLWLKIVNKHRQPKTTFSPQLFKFLQSVNPLQLWSSSGKASSHCFNGLIKILLTKFSQFKFCSNQEKLKYVLCQMYSVLSLSFRCVVYPNIKQFIKISSEEISNIVQPSLLLTTKIGGKRKVKGNKLLFSLFNKCLLFSTLLVPLAARYLLGPMCKREQTKQYQLHHLWNQQIPDWSGTGAGAAAPLGDKHLETGGWHKLLAVLHRGRLSHRLRALGRGERGGRKQEWWELPSNVHPELATL